MFIFSVSLSLFVFSVSLSGVLFYFGSSEWRLSSWFLAESTRKPCRRIGIWDTLAAGSATSRWLDSATFYETNILIASSATRRSSPTLATIAIASSVSTPRYDWYGRLSQTADQDKDGSVKRNHRLGESLDQFTFDFISSIFYVFCVFVCCFGDVLMCWFAERTSTRICRTRIDTGTRPVSCATSAACRWSTSSLAPKLTRFSVDRATIRCTPLAVTDVAKSSVPVSKCFIDLYLLYFFFFSKKRWNGHIAYRLIWFRMASIWF